MNRLEQWLLKHPHTRVVLLTIYYLVIILILILMYGRGNFETPEFIYQEF